MGLLKFFGLSNPLTDYLEEELSKKAVDILKNEGSNIPDNWREKKGKLKGEINSKIKQLVEDQNKKIKPNWKEFKGKVSQLISEAIVTAFKKSKLDNYSYEKSWEIIAVSKEAIRKKSLEELIFLLHDQIGIKDLSNETIIALAKYAFDIKFDQQFNSLIDKREIFHADYRDYVIVDKIKNDRYYIDEEETSQQVEMIFLSEVDKYTASGFGKSEHQKEKEEQKENKKRVKTSFDRWKDFKNDRPNDRRFPKAQWN